MRASLVLATALAVAQAIDNHFDLDRSGAQEVLMHMQHDKPGRLDAEPWVVNPESPEACAACEVRRRPPQVALLALKGAAAIGDDFFINVVTELCKRFRVWHLLLRWSSLVRCSM
jgi:hypothetical protein